MDLTSRAMACYSGSRAIRSCGLPPATFFLDFGLIAQALNIAVYAIARWSTVAYMDHSREVVLEAEI